MFSGDAASSHFWLWLAVGAAAILGHVFPFYLKFKGKPANEITDLFYSGLRPTPRRLAAAYRYLNPQATLDQFSGFMESRLPGFRGSDGHTLRAMYEGYGPGNYSLSDQSYLAHVHPLELWLARYLTTRPDARFKDAVEAFFGPPRVVGWMLIVSAAWIISASLITDTLLCGTACLTRILKIP